MSITLTHLTDLHIKANTDLTSKIHPFCQAVIRNARNSSHLYIIVGGDIANTGKKEEYDAAKKFFSNIRLLIKSELPNLEIKFILVPGNHDCNFEHDSQLRRNTIDLVSYKSIGTDESVLNTGLIVQKEFWEFYSDLIGNVNNRIFFQTEDIIDGKRIVFNCLNTSWMSSIHEGAGTLFYPVSLYYSKLENPGALNVCVWHHPYNWFTPSSEENNKKEFEEFTQQAGGIQFCGHEHYSASFSIDNLSTNKTTNLFPGTLFNDNGDENNSGFQVLQIDLESDEVILRKYTFGTDAYKDDEEISVTINNIAVKSKLPISSDFLALLDEIKIPLNIGNKKNIFLSEVYVFPDLDSAKLESKQFDNYVNAKSLLTTDKNCMIDGESQIGKSSLLNMLYKQFYEMGMLPIILKGSEIKDLNIEKQLKKAFKSQYEQVSDFEQFMQAQKQLKVLLIDDFSDCGFNSSTTKQYYELIEAEFGKIIMMIASADSLLPSLHTEFKDVLFYSIKPLGYKKRNELIEKYLLLKENKFTVDGNVFAESVNTYFDNVQDILGNKFIPSYPVYILSILQALDYNPLNLNETSFGYCYQTLIHYALHKAGISNSQVDTYVNFLTELAYQFIKKDVGILESKDVMEFYSIYSKKFLCPQYDILFTNLKKSKLIIEDHDGLRFGYNYILYYLSAKKISEISGTQEGKEMISHFFDGLDIEKNANILVFITHHSRDLSFIEQSLLNSMMVLESTQPITLEKNDPFYKRLEGLADEIKKDILEASNDPKVEREKMLENKDKANQELEQFQAMNPEEFAEVQKIALPFKQSFRSIEIVGQIIKNRKGSIEISKINEMISELYITAFRTISYLSSMMFEAKNEIVEYIATEVDDQYYRRNVEKKIDNFLQYACLEACFGTFGKLIQAVGTKDLKKQYEQVAITLNTPAAKLVSFGINSYYGSFTYEELKKLADDLKGNHVGLLILRARVKSYVYMKKLDFKTKQRFASCIGMEVSQPQLNKKGEIRKFITR